MWDLGAECLPADVAIGTGGHVSQQAFRWVWTLRIRDRGDGVPRNRLRCSSLRPGTVANQRRDAFALIEVLEKGWTRNETIH